MSAISSVLKAPGAFRRFLLKTAVAALSGRAPIGGRFYVGYQATEEYIDEYVALSLSVVWACVMAIAESIAASRFQIFVEDEEGIRSNVRGDLYELLNGRPNPEQSRFDFLVMLVVNALIDKAGYAEIVRDGRGRAVALWPIKATRVCRERIGDELFFRVFNHLKPDVLIHHENMICIRFLSLDGENSTPIIDFARDVFARAKATRDFGSAFYRNGTNFGGIFSPKENIGVKDAKDYAEMIREQFADVRDSHGNLFMPAAIEYKAMGIEPDKAQFIQTEQHIVEEITRYFRVPPHKVQHLLRATFNNIEHLGIEFVRDAVTPWAERIVGELNYKVLSYAGLKCRMDLDWLREGDAESVAAAEATRIFSAQSSPDEARNRRGENPIPGGLGQKFVMQSGMTTIDKIGEDNGKTNDQNPGIAGSDIGAGRGLLNFPIVRSRPKENRQEGGRPRLRLR